jgi:large subunit ribosomal protein L18
MKATKTLRAARIRRHTRVRKHVNGTGERPRLAVFRSLTHIYAQVIDDVERKTIAAASDVEADLQAKVKGKKKEEVAALIGTLVAERAKEKGVSKVVFDRGGFVFHGRVKALAEAARESGLDF